MERIPDGTHEARIVSIAYIGTIKREYKGKLSHRKTILISYEMSEVERDTQDGPLKMVLSEEYTFSLGDRAFLRKHIEAILGRSLNADETDYANKSGMFRVTNLLGMPCNVTVENSPWESNGKSGINTKVKSVSSVPKKYIEGIAKAQRVLTNFDIRRYRTLFDLRHCDVYRMQNKFVKMKIHKSEEYKKLIAQDLSKKL